MITVAASWLVAAALVSTLFDLTWYSTRQDNWEKKHPGKVYIRNYRKLKKMGLVD